MIQIAVQKKSVGLGPPGWGPKPRTAPVTATEIVSDFITGVPPKDVPAFSLCLLPIITRRDWDLKSPRRVHVERASRPAGSELVARLVRKLVVARGFRSCSPSVDS